MKFSSMESMTYLISYTGVGMLVLNDLLNKAYSSLYWMSGIPYIQFSSPLEGAGNSIDISCMEVTNVSSNLR
jgi:hypothetical protein